MFFIFVLWPTTTKYAKFLTMAHMSFRPNELRFFAERSRGQESSWTKRGGFGIRMGFE